MNEVANPGSSAVVLIGTAEYDHADVERVPSVSANLDDLYDALLDPGIWGVPAENITVLRDERDPASVYDAIRAAARSTRDDGLFLVYYAGHGFPYDDDLVLGLREVDPQFPDEKGLRYPKIRQATQLAIALRRVVILDCCFAGRAGREVLDAGDAVKQIAGRAEISAEETYLLVAVGPNELAKAPLNDRHTAFTSALLHVLTTGSETADPVLSIRTVAEKVIRRVVAAGHRRPEFRAANAAVDAPLVRNARLRPHDLTGVVLEATADVTDPELRGAVILVLRHNDSGALGVRLNRDFGPLPAALDGWRDHVSLPDRLFDGGPVAQDGFISLVRLREHEERPIRFTEVTGLLGSLPLSDAQQSARDRIADLRIFRGYLGWRPGALERLVTHGRLRITDTNPFHAAFARAPFTRTGS
ncbi:hypothetical protein Q0Z83_044930 [Actinoplanes sichuanensis]|uniref:YqgE/AlgH family protein n=1 Tax=Actinoplanes sichuanensis TaxID=512349 RepID=A0ABW4AS34_9ACTN|nr:YqgE/AlgH family protein [Actinoplanes sichuanensis]BEL06302.1 hypothetical protein Q0Z83_044930 [Actinoplanes sichuanensis]